MKAIATLTLILGGCNLLTPVTPLSPLEEQLTAANQALLESARNALNQANTALLPLTGRVNSAGVVDLDAFQRMNDQVLPAMTNAGNALIPELQAQHPELVTEFRRLYTEALAPMLEGLNRNLNLYQASFETPQAQDVSTNPERAQSAMASLAQLFAASEITERFAAELQGYASLLESNDQKAVLDSLKAQQTTIINGVLTFARQGLDPASIRQAYLTIAQSLTSANLLSELAALAIEAYGADRVALRADVLTPSQPSANQLVLVVQEADDQYRLLELQNNQIVDRLIQDTRGLSASDLLYKTNVIQVGTP